MTLGNQIKWKNSTFSEHGHVAYQIKGKHECSNILANILPAPLPPPWVSIGQNVYFYVYLPIIGTVHLLIIQNKT